MAGLPTAAWLLASSRREEEEEREREGVDQSRHQVNRQTERQGQKWW